MITNKKYLIYSFIFLSSISLHGFVDHHDHFNSIQEYSSECQACEENVEIKVSESELSNVHFENSFKTNLTSRFVSFKSKSNLSRAPPLN